jgi:hypothetical protein
MAGAVRPKSAAGRARGGGRESAAPGALTAVQLDQAITETLQAIDSDFGRANELSSDILREARRLSTSMAGMQPHLQVRGRRGCARDPRRRAARPPQPSAPPCPAGAQVWKSFLGTFAPAELRGVYGGRAEEPHVDDAAWAAASGASVGPAAPGGGAAATPRAARTAVGTPGSLARGRGVTLDDLGEGPVGLFSPPISTPFYKAQMSRSRAGGASTGRRRTRRDADTGAAVAADEDEDEDLDFAGDAGDDTVGFQFADDALRMEEEEGDGNELPTPEAPSFSRRVTAILNASAARLPGTGAGAAGLVHSIAEADDDSEGDQSGLGPSDVPLFSRSFKATRPEDEDGAEDRLGDGAGGGQATGDGEDAENDDAPTSLPLHRLPAAFQTGKGAVEVSAVWTCVKDHGERGLTAGAVADIVADISAPKAELLLSVLSARGFLRTAVSARGDTHFFPRSAGLHL